MSTIKIVHPNETSTGMRVLITLCRDYHDVFVKNASEIMLDGPLETQCIVGTIRNGEAKCRGSSHRETAYSRVIGAFDDLLLMPCSREKRGVVMVDIKRAEQELEKGALVFAHPLAYSGIWEVAESENARVWVLQPSGMLAMASIEDMFPLLRIQRQCGS